MQPAYFRFRRDRDSSQRAGEDAHSGRTGATVLLGAPCARMRSREPSDVPPRPSAQPPTPRGGLQAICRMRPVIPPQVGDTVLAVVTRAHRLQRSVCAFVISPVCPSRLALLVVADHPPSAFGVVRVVSERGIDRDRGRVGSEGQGESETKARGWRATWNRCGGVTRRASAPLGG
jgi:hypothetical protein